jgi:hypothetical protein
MESLRVHPPAPLVGKLVTEAHTLGGHKGTCTSGACCARAPSGSVCKRPCPAPPGAAAIPVPVDSMLVVNAYMVGSAACGPVALFAE